MEGVEPPEEDLGQEAKAANVADPQNSSAQSDSHDLENDPHSCSFFLRGDASEESEKVKRKRKLLPTGGFRAPGFAYRVAARIGDTLRQRYYSDPSNAS